MTRVELPVIPAISLTAYKSRLSRVTDDLPKDMNTLKEDKILKDSNMKKKKKTEMHKPTNLVTCSTLNLPRKSKKISKY